MSYQGIIEQNKEWIDKTFENLDKKLSRTSVKSRDKIPYTTKNGEHDFKDYEKCEPTCVSDGRTLAYKQCVNCSTIRNENLTPAVEYTGSMATAFF